jgi:hypothetical protein
MLLSRIFFEPVLFCTYHGRMAAWSLDGLAIGSLSLTWLVWVISGRGMLVCIDTLDTPLANAQGLQLPSF